MRVVATKNNLTKSIVVDLGIAIVTGHYTGREFPTEKELCEQYNASRTVLREAVKMLTAKGLLSARPRQGTRVEPEDNWNLIDPDVLRWLLERKFSLDFLIEFTEIRLAVEPAAAALAARNASLQEREAISAAFARMRAAERGEDDTLNADIAFHVSILNASGNRFFRQFRDMIETALRISILKTNNLMGIEKSETQDHARIADAIVSGDPQLAERRMRDLIEYLLRLLREARAAEA